MYKRQSSNRLTRLLGIDSEPVNHGWLCDKGRFVFEAVNGEVGAGVGIAVEDDGGHAQGRGAGKFHDVMADKRHALGRQVHGLEGGLVGFLCGHDLPQVCLLYTSRCV